jgi:hypothetical protein
MAGGIGRLATRPKVNGSRCSARTRSSCASSHIDPGMRASLGSGAKTGVSGHRLPRSLWGGTTGRRRVRIGNVG